MSTSKFTTLFREIKLSVTQGLDFVQPYLGNVKNMSVAELFLLALVIAIFLPLLPFVLFLFFVLLAYKIFSQSSKNNYALPAPNAQVEVKDLTPNETKE
jgi:hypothetical protein